jgi:hypothetical protein
MDALQGRSTGVNLNLVDRLPTGKGGHETGKAEDMIQVAVSDENTVQALKTEARFEYLALRTLSTIYKKSILIMDYHLGG